MSERSTSDKVADQIEIAVLALRQAISEFIAPCQSPIEQLFAVQFCMQGYGFWHEDPPHERRIAWCWYRNRPITKLVSQYEIATSGKVYRADFVMLHGANRVVIECDGHEFHEKTKEQAAGDKARDRALVLAGWTVLRFTGSEIYRDSMGCLLEALQAARAVGGSDE